MKLRLSNSRYINGLLTREEKERMNLEKRKASSSLRRDEREAFGVLIEDSNWLGPGSLQDIIRQQY